MALYCSRCGNQIPENSQFCSFCGEKIDSLVLQKRSSEIVLEKETKPKKQSKYSEDDINQMKTELAEHEARQKSFSSAGAAILVAGIILLILGIVFLVVAFDSYSEGAFIAIGSIAISFGAVLPEIGIALLVVASAVFGKKAENRRRAIKEYEGEQQ